MDLARITAIGAVVMIHAIAPVVSGAHGVEFSHPRWWLGNVIDSTCRFAVPLFVMLSGSLLLAPARAEGIREFYARRLARIGIPLAFWVVVYLGYRKYVAGQAITLWDAVQRVASGYPEFHLYFMFILIGLYAATPFLRIVVNALTERATVALCLLLLSLGALDQILRSFLDVGGSNAVTMFLPYLGYYLAGHVLQTTRLPRGGVRGSGIVFVLCTAFTALGTWFLALQHGWSRQASYLYEYLSPTVILASLAAFILLRAIPERLTFVTRPSVAGRVRSISSLTFGVYLVHPLLMPLADAFEVHPSRAPALLVAVSAYWALLLTASLALVAVARRVPLLRRVF